MILGKAQQFTLHSSVDVRTIAVGDFSVRETGLSSEQSLAQKEFTARDQGKGQ